jgi:hypothetical protein
MGIGTSVFVIALGAVLTFAVETDSTEGINVNSVGIILMIAGVLGLVVTALVWGPRRARVVAATPVAPVQYVERPVATRTVVERVDEVR